MLDFAWLEITGRCQLRCMHCYADSGPTGTHGTMKVADWRNVIDDLAALGARTVQLIGGEPTIHPSFAELIEHASSMQLRVEIFSNLVHIRPDWWDLFARCGVGLATSYYSDRRCEHEEITRSRGSHQKTRANIAEAIARHIPLRVGIITTHEGQRAEEARHELETLGVSSIAFDRLRGVGRGAVGQKPDVLELCGLCAERNVAVGPDGTVWPCVFSRWLPVGNVRQSSLAEILLSPATTSTKAMLKEAFEARMPCVPDMCNPQCGPSCSPACTPTGDCRPVGGCTPKYDEIMSP